MNKVENFLQPVINKELWGIRHNLGSMLKFEFGTKIEEDRGTYHFCISNCNWWLQKGKDKTFEDIVNSESSQENIIEKIQLLNGKKLLASQYDEELAATILDFDNDLFLKIAPYSNNNDLDQWLLFTPEKTLKVKSNGDVFIIDSE